MIALEAKYHGRCIVALCNSARKAGIMHVKLPIHIRGMTLLSENYPGIYDEFCAGKFVVHKTSNKFSAMAINQCHEQNNAVVRVRWGCWTDD